LPTARTTACGRWLPATVAGSAVEGNVDRTGASVHFSEPISVMLDEWGRLLVLHTIDNGSVRVVEASLSPPQRLAVQPVMNPLMILVEDYSKLLRDMKMTDVTFAVDRQRFPVHLCVLVARSPYFRALFKSGKACMRKGAARLAKILFSRT